MKKILAIVVLVFAFGTRAYAQQDILKSSASYPCMFLMIDSSDHISAKTGLSPTVTISKSGASFASPSGSVTEIANGWYKVAGNATDSNTDGPLLLHATGSGADPTDITCGTVVEFDPRSATTLQNIVDAVLNEATSGHTTSGTVSKAIIDIGSKTSGLTFTTSGQVDAQAISIAANAVTAAAIASNAITSAKIATDAITSTGLAASAVTEMQTGLATPTNITAGTITTVTNLTNAPTAGDLTSTMKASVRTGSAVIQKSTSRQIAFKLVNSTTGAAMTSGTPTCTRSIDDPASFSSTTNAASAMSVLGFSELTLSTSDTNASSYIIVRCTLTSANDFNNIFYIN